MTPDILFFFNKDPAALPLYEAFETRVLAEIDNVTIRVQKTQITYTKKGDNYEKVHKLDFSCCNVFFPLCSRIRSRFD